MACISLKHSSDSCVLISLGLDICESHTCLSQAGKPNGRPGLGSTCLEIKRESVMSQNKQFNMGSHFQNFHWKTSSLIPCESGCGPGIVMQNKWRPLAQQAVTFFIIRQRRCGKMKACCGDCGIPISASCKKDFTFETLDLIHRYGFLSETVKTRNVFLLFRVHL